jgi:hypothetical protein
MPTEPPVLAVAPPTEPPLPVVALPAEPPLPVVALPAEPPAPAAPPAGVEAVSELPHPVVVASAIRTSVANP